jgi:nucleolar protein 58
MRLREWYGWHFPELSKILTDGLVYAKAVRLMGMKVNCKKTDFSAIGVPEEIEAEVRERSKVTCRE